MARRTIYMIRETGGTMRTNDPRAVPAFEAIGFRPCAREEYLAMGRQLQREDARACGIRQGVHSQ